MHYARILAGAILCSAAALASAATLPTNNFTLDLSDTNTFGNKFEGTGYKDMSFLDIYSFSIPSNSDLGSSLTSFATRKTYDLDITSFDLYSGSTRLVQGVRVSNGTLDVWTLEGLSISSGSYNLRVAGTILGTSGGSYGGNANVSPVPEPEAWSMVGVGLAVAGVMARRRRPRQAPTASAA